MSEFAARFVQEAKAAAKLSHPGIVTVHEADIYNGRPVLVMELVDGESLGQILSRGPLAGASALAVLEQLLDAVGYARSRGIVRWDIKQDNVFVTRDARVKLGDFGIAPVGDTVALTHAGTVLGTPGYMAPEQVTGDPVDARADLFAIGVLAYEMRAGKNPFGASDNLPITAVLLRIVEKDPPGISEPVLRGLPVDMRAILKVALAKDRKARFPDARSFLAALRGEAPVSRLVALVGESRSSSSARGDVRGAGAVVKATRRARSARSWLPYVAVLAVGIVAAVVLLAMAGNGGSSSGPASLLTATTAGPL